MYYIFLENEKLNGAGQCPVINEEVENLEVSEDVYNAYCAEPEKFVYQDGEIVENPNYEEEQAEKRKQAFYTHFIKTSLGNYRLQPKGYANAQQAMDVTNTMATALGGLTEQLVPLVIFYETPDFSKAEECTEEWLVAHQKNPSVMTLEEWQKFYFEFCQLYAMQQYKSEVVDENTTDTTTDIPNEVGTKATDKLNAN